MLGYIYTIWDGRIERCTLEAYNPTTQHIEGRDSKGRKFMSSLGTMYFKTPEEAVREDYNITIACLAEAREEVQDALASYREIKRIANTPFEEYFKSIPKDF